MMVCCHRLVLGLIAIVGVSACASIVGTTESSVQIRTNPEHSHCDLKGRDGSRLGQVDTPAAVTLPGSAAPVIVTCTAPGFRPTTHSLNTSANGWIWGNSALIVATGGAAVVGLLVDESRGAGMSYDKDVSYELDRDRPRTLKAKQRDGSQGMDLQTR